MSGVLEQSIIIVFSLHLGEPMVLDIAMLLFICLPYTVLHHDFQFFYLISFSEFVLGWYNDWLFWFFFLGIFMFFFMFFFSSWVHGVSYGFHALEIPLLPFIIGSWIWMDNQECFKDSLRRGLLLRLI